MFRYLNQSNIEFFGSIFYSHKRGISYCTAFENTENVTLCLKIPTGMAATAVGLQLFTECGRYVESYVGAWNSRHFGYELFLFDFGKLSVGLYFYEIYVSTPSGELFAAPTDMNTVRFLNKRCHKFQLSVSKFKYKAPKKYGGVIYQIFVDRFSVGKGVIKKENGVYPESFEVIPEYPEYPGAPLKNNTFYGGNLSGITEKLSYFKELGVNMLYLTPIFESSSNHKYDTADYMRVDSGFGGDEALCELIQRGRDVGISIILDGVFNHTGADSVYFNKYSVYDTLGAYNSKASKYYEWYEFESYPDKYNCWWGIDILPRIRSGASSFKEFISGSGGVIDKYIALGVLGFRLDVVDELDDEFVQSIRKRLAAANKNAFLYGEVWEDASNKIAYGKRKKYYLGKELDGVMNYPMRRGIVDFVMRRGCGALKYALCDVYNNAPRRISDFQMNILGSHDTPRILTLLSDSFDENKPNFRLAVERMSSAEKEVAKLRLICAYTILATLPGIPMIYYGDEVGVEGYSDPFNRLPYPHGKEDYDLLNHYRKIGKIRANNSVYRQGDFKLLHVDDEILIFARYTRSYAYITAANVAHGVLNIKFDDKARNILDGAYELMYNLNENEAAVFRIRQSSNLHFKKELYSDAL